jgi:hypothetical protein
MLRRVTAVPKHNICPASRGLAPPHHQKASLHLLLSPLYPLYLGIIGVNQVSQRESPQEKTPPHTTPTVLFALFAYALLFRSSVQSTACV